MRSRSLLNSCGGFSRDSCDIVSSSGRQIGVFTQDYWVKTLAGCFGPSARPTSLHLPAPAVKCHTHQPLNSSRESRALTSTPTSAFGKAETRPLELRICTARSKTATHWIRHAAHVGAARTTRESNSCFRRSFCLLQRVRNCRIHMPKAWNISGSQREDNLCRQFCELCLQSTGQCAVKTNQLTVIENGIQIPFKCGAENGSNVSNWAKRREHLTTSATFAAALSQRSQMEGGDEPHLRCGGSNRQEACGDGTDLRDIEAITSREEAASAVVVASQDGGLATAS